MWNSRADTCRWRRQWRKKLVPGIEVRALAWSEGQLTAIEDIRGADEDAHDRRRIGARRWWIRQWRKPNGIYRLRVLTPEQRALARRLVRRDGMPPEAFPRADGALDMDNDANIVAEVIAL